LPERCTYNYKIGRKPHLLLASEVASPPVSILFVDISDYGILAKRQLDVLVRLVVVRGLTVKKRKA
jgi:hypothetical protein